MGIWLSLFIALHCIIMGGPKNRERQRGGNVLMNPTYFIVHVSELASSVENS